MRPPAGVECAWCRISKEHRCQAQIYVDGNNPVCLPCADGDPCVLDRVGAPRLEGPEMFEVETPPAPIIHRTPEELGLSATVPAGPGARRWLSDEEFAQEKRKAFELAAAVRRRAQGVGRRMLRPRVVETLRGSRKAVVREVVIESGEAVLMSPHSAMGAEMIEPEKRTQMKEDGEMDEMREEVKKLGGTMSDRELGEKLGVSGSRVGQLRKELGIAATKPGPKGGKKPQKSTALIHPGQRAVEIDSGPHPGVDTLAGDDTVRVSIEMTRAQACERFGSLSPAQMGIALEAAMKAAARS